MKSLSHYMTTIVDKEDFHECSLCGHQVLTEHLSKHQESEANELVQLTIKMIRDRNPNWVETDGTCQKCWDYYQKL